MYYEKKLIDEFCKVGKLETHRNVLEDIFTGFELKPVGISCRTDGFSSSAEAGPNGTHIRINVRDRENPLHIIWDLLHEYGHFFNGPVDDKTDKNKVALREYRAWQFASDFFNVFPELQPYRAEFNKYRQVCFSSYVEKLQLNYKVEPILRKHMPSLLELLGGQAISWTSIDRGLTDFIKGIRIEVYTQGVTVMKETTFYSMLTEKALGGHKADAMFDNYNLLFSELISKLSPEERRPVRTIVYDLLANLNNNHMHSIGELSVLNYYLDTGEYDFVTIEEKIVEGSAVSADISLRRKSDRAKVQIEVQNLRLDKQNFNDYGHMRYYLDSKFKQKLKEKRYESTDILSIQPVLWYRDDQQFKWIRNFFIDTNYSHEGILDPMAYCSYKVGDSEFLHEFGKITAISLTLPTT
jgi:hypothetical protein